MQILPTLPTSVHPPTYGAKQQFSDPITDTILSPSEKKWIEEVVGVFLYYARAIDSTMLLPIGSIASAKSTNSFANLKHRIHHFLDYAATHPDATLKYYASDMHLWAASDASYLCESRARSRAGGILFLSDKPHFPILPDSPPPTPNGHTQVISKIIDTVMSSAQESENGAGFITAKEIMASRVTLEEMGHEQTTPTPLQFDNKCAVGIINDQVRQKASKCMDMRFYWLRDRVRQNLIHVYWKYGIKNDADYPTKHHPTKHHIQMRGKFVLNCTTREY